MPRPKDPNKKVQLSVRVKPHLRDKVQDLAKTDDRFKSRSDVIGQAVEAFLKDLKEPQRV